LLALPDCIYLLEYGRCDILTVSTCRGENCSFNISALAAKNSREQWKQRLQCHDVKTQMKIARKYYGGDTSSYLTRKRT